MLNNFSIQQINHLIELLETLTPSLYAEYQDPVFGSTVGQHTRHIISHYVSFYENYHNSTTICYDKRERNNEIETNISVACRELKNIIDFLSSNESDKNLTILSEIDGKYSNYNSSLKRELLYLTEHTTHHIAIIRFILSIESSNKTDFGNLGLAYSTPKNN